MSTVIIDRELLDEVVEWMRANPPTDGWGCLDHGADAERAQLTARIDVALDAPAKPPGTVTISCNRHHDCSKAPKGQLCCFDPKCDRIDCQVRR